MKTLVVYYSRSGNNRYLAERLARELGSDIEEISPRFKGFFFLLLFSAMKKSFGIRKLSSNVGSYDTVVLCGPIWMGQLVSPLRDFIVRYGKEIKKLHFVTCCGSDDAGKDDKFGYASVFKLAEALLPGKFAGGEAFPIGLVLPEGMKSDDEVIKIRLTEENFRGEMAARLEKLAADISKAT